MDLDQSELDVSPDSSPETQVEEHQPAEPSPSEPSQEAAQPKAESEVPFHMHPRFQELVHEKNQYREQLQALSKQVEDLKKLSAQQTQPQKDALLERLKGIDPEFAERFGKVNEVDTLKQELEEFRQWREQMAIQQTQSQIESLKDKFYQENNIPAEQRDLYEALVSQQAAKDPSLKISDLPRVMKQVHESIGKMFQKVERSTAKSFVEGKKTEAAKPTSLPKGAPAKAVKADQQNLSRQELRELIKKEALEEARSGKDI